MKKEIRQKRVIRRKNFFSTLVITIILWTVIFSIIYFVDPDSLGTIQIFFLCIFLGLLFTFSIIFANKRRGFILSCVLTIFLFLRYIGVGNILNFLLLAGAFLAFELYLNKPPRS